MIRNLFVCLLDVWISVPVNSYGHVRMSDSRSVVFKLRLEHIYKQHTYFLSIHAGESINKCNALFKVFMLVKVTTNPKHYLIHSCWRKYQ